MLGCSMGSGLNVMSRKSSKVSLGAKPREPSVCEKPRELLIVSEQASGVCYWLGSEADREVWRGDVRSSGILGNNVR